MLQLLPKAVPPFDVFFQENYERVVGYTYKKIGNFQDAEDLASEVFLYCQTHYESYDPEKSSLTTWLYMVVNSRIKNHYRDAKTNVDLDSLSGILPDDSRDMDACIYLEQVRTVIRKALQKLPERQKKLIELRYFQGLSGNEIAQVMNMTPGNVRVQLSRALDAMEPLCKDLL